MRNHLWKAWLALFRRKQKPFKRLCFHRYVATKVSVHGEIMHVRPHCTQCGQVFDRRPQVELVECPLDLLQEVDGAIAELLNPHNVVSRQRLEAILDEVRDVLADHR